jgi:hypothetical protein
MKTKKLGFEFFLISVSVLSFSISALADDHKSGEAKSGTKIHGDVSASAGYSPGNGTTVGASASLKTGPMKFKLNSDYNSITQAMFEPKIEGDAQVGTYDGAVQKAGVALKGFNITTAVDFRRGGGNVIGIAQMLSPTLQYKKDNRLGVTELPRLDYFRVGLVTPPSEKGEMCGILFPAYLAPNAVQAMAVDGKTRVGISWNVDGFCHFELGKKTGQFDLQAGLEATLILGGGENGTMGKVYADGRFKNIAGSPVYAGAQVSGTGVSTDTFSRSVSDTSAFAGIAY